MTFRSPAIGTIALLAAAMFAAAASASSTAPPKHETPIPAATLELMAARGTDAAAPILVRAFKKEAELEVWKKNRGGRFVLLKTFPICRWSGQLGPKQKEGDRQTPEGFYAVTPKLMNPNSAYYLSFDVGFPNAYDKARKSTGSALMVHGTCSSRGCFAMTDAGIAEIYALAREAFAGGQAAFQFQAFPFRMTAQNMARHRADQHYAFWQMLKEGADRFEATGEEPAVDVRDGRYGFRPLRNGSRESQAQARIAAEQARIAALIEDGVAAVRTTYSDGGQHASFAALERKGVSLGTVSRPEALALAGREVVVIPARPKKIEVAGPTPPALLVEPTAARDIPAPSVPVAMVPDAAIFAWTALDRGGASGRGPTIRGGALILATHLLPRTGALAMQ